MKPSLPPESIITDQQLSIASSLADLIYPEVGDDMCMHDKR
jgi:hypothetical protein